MCKKKIIFQKCHFNNIYFLFYFIVAFLNILIEYSIFNGEKKNNPDIKLILPSKILNSLYIANISDFFAFIPHLIRKRLLKKKEENITSIEIENNRNSGEGNLIYNDYNISVTNKKKKTTLIYLILVGILDFFEKFALILYHILCSTDQYDIPTFSCIVPFEIICQFICSYILLKIKFHKLQYFSLFLNLGIFIIILIFDLVVSNNNKNENDNFDAKILLFYTFNIIFYSIEFSLGKKIFLHGYISIYLLIIIKGSIVFILSLIFSLIVFFINKEVFSQIGYFFTVTKYIWLMIAKIFCGFFLSLFTWLIIDIFSPNYFPLSLLIYEISYFIVDIIYNRKRFSKVEWDLYVRIFLYLVSFIGVMIHNEIVVINICNLGSDTKYFLDLEVESEEIFAKTDNPEIMKRYESLIEMESEVEDQNENKEIIN